MQVKCVKILLHLFRQSCRQNVKNGTPVNRSDSSDPKSSELILHFNPPEETPLLRTPFLLVDKPDRSGKNNWGEPAYVHWRFQQLGKE